MTTCHYQYYTFVLISITLYSNHINPNFISKFDLKILVNTAADLTRKCRLIMKL